MKNLKIMLAVLLVSSSVAPLTAMAVEPRVQTALTPHEIDKVIAGYLIHKQQRQMRELTSKAMGAFGVIGAYLVIRSGLVSVGELKEFFTTPARDAQGNLKSVKPLLRALSYGFGGTQLLRMVYDENKTMNDFVKYQNAAVFTLLDYLKPEDQEAILQALYKREFKNDSENYTF
jgi:hypothetical protein